MESRNYNIDRAFICNECGKAAEISQVTNIDAMGPMQCSQCGGSLVSYYLILDPANHFDYTNGGGYIADISMLGLKPKTQISGVLR